jgi:hypothetical protein
VPPLLFTGFASPYKPAKNAYDGAASRCLRNSLLIRLGLYMLSNTTTTAVAVSTTCEHAHYIIYIISLHDASSNLDMRSSFTRREHLQLRCAYLW